MMRWSWTKQQHGATQEAPVSAGGVGPTTSPSATPPERFIELGLYDTAATATNQIPTPDASEELWPWEWSKYGRRFWRHAGHHKGTHANGFEDWMEPEEALRLLNATDTSEGPGDVPEQHQGWHFELWKTKDTSTTTTPISPPAPQQTGVEGEWVLDEHCGCLCSPDGEAHLGSLEAVRDHLNSLTQSRPACEQNKERLRQLEETDRMVSLMVRYFHALDERRKKRTLPQPEGGASS